MILQVVFWSVLIIPVFTASKRRVAMDKITEIRQDILSSKDERIWEDFINETNTIADKVFTSSTHYLMEFIQNAEDAGRRRNDNVDGRMDIYLSQERIKIEHNGKPFSKDDVDSICGVRSRKDPGKGDIGYLGIGFKSVFKITDQPQIYSGDYSFKFDKNRCEEEWDFEVPWKIIPFSANPSESIDRGKTTFIIPFRDEGGPDYRETRDELEQIGVHVFLFLDWLKVIRIVNEETGEERYIEHTQQTRERIWESENHTSGVKDEEKEVSERIERIESQFTENNQVHRFIVFKGIFGVPDEVRMDEETVNADRGSVTKREISIAFPLDETRNLNLELPGKMRRGLYSFLPLEEAETGTKFLIQGDFIVQPGREDMLWQAEWNKWMVEKVEEVAEQALDYFQTNPDREVWRRQYIPMFEFEKVEGDVYSELIEPILREGIEKKTDRSELVLPCLCCEDNITIDQAVKLTGDVAKFYEDDLIDRRDLELMFDIDDPHFIGTDIETGRRDVEELELDDLHDKEVIQRKERQGDDVVFLQRLFDAMERSYLTKFVVDEQGNVVKEDEVYRRELPESVKELEDEGFNVDSVLSEYDFVKEELLETAGDSLDIDTVSYEDICRKTVLPKLKTDSRRISEDNALTYAKMIKGADIQPTESIWVIDTDGQVVSSEDVFLSNTYNSERNWEEFREYVGIGFLSDNYFELDDDVSGWRSFFRNTGMNGYSSSDYSEIVEESILPKIKPGNNISEEKLIMYTRIVRSGLDEKLNIPSILVVTENGGIKTSNQVFYGSAYSPKQDWSQQNLMDLNLLSSRYVEYDVEARDWKRFFDKAGVSSEAENERVRNFGDDLVRDALEGEYQNVRSAGGSHDLSATRNGEEVYIEVKSHTNSDIDEETLNPSQSKLAMQERENFVLAYVYGIPENPEIRLLENPAEYSENPQLVIPTSAIQNESRSIQPES